MSVITRKASAWFVADVLAGLVLLARRKLGTMALAADSAVKTGSELEPRLLREEIAKGSSWAALCLAVSTRPTDLPELLKEVGVYRLTGARRKRAFDACVDGYTVFHDGRCHRRI